MYDLADKLRNSVYLGEYIELYDAPIDGNFILSGTSLLRSEYPELDALYPYPSSGGTDPTMIEIPAKGSKYVRVR